MKVEIFRLSGQPVEIEVPEGSTITQLFDVPGSGVAIGRPEMTLAEAANEVYGSVFGLGSIRVNGENASLTTLIPAGASVFLIPKVEGGKSGA